MVHKNKLSLPSAILINLNIMLGAGLFLNTDLLAKRAGALGFLMYPLIALIMMPLIISLAKLVKIYPETGFYGYGANSIHPSIGFFSSWSYFVGKLSSAMLMIHVALSLIHQTIPLLHNVSVILLDVIVVTFFICLNMLNIQTGSTIQIWFIALKTIPIFFSIFTGLFLFDLRNYSLVNMNFDGIATSLPLVLYAISGFEAACSLSCKIKDAHKNGPLAIYISYGIWTLITLLYQLTFYGAVGTSLHFTSNYLGIFPLLLGMILPGSECMAAILQGILYLAIASSALGSGYGILFSNTWNLYSLASSGHTFLKNALTRLNRYGLPTLCLIIEGAFCFLYLFVTGGDRLPLLQTSALACSIAYTMSVISLLVLVFYKKSIRMRWWIPVLALCSCLLLIRACILNFIISGVYPLIVFLSLLGFGICMFVYTSFRPRIASTKFDSN